MCVEKYCLNTNDAGTKSYFCHSAAGKLRAVNICIENTTVKTSQRTILGQQTNRFKTRTKITQKIQVALQFDGATSLITALGHHGESFKLETSFLVEKKEH